MAKAESSIVELSVVVDLRAVETVLPEKVERLLELVGELTPRFEVLLIDDTDGEARREVLTGLCRTFPQLRLLAARERGLRVTGELGIERAQGEVVLLLDDLEKISTRQLRGLWESKRDGAGSAFLAEAPGWLEQLLAWGERLRDSAVRSGERAPDRIPETARRPQQGLNQVVLEYRKDSSHPIPAPPKGMSFLQHLRNLAVSESGGSLASPYISGKGEGK